MRSIIDLIGLYNWDDTLFDNMSLPAEWSAEERGQLISNLLLDTAELEILYPQPVMMKYAINLWSEKELPQWEKLYETLHFDYNPIWNKDGTITETENINRKTDEDITAGHTEDESGESSEKANSSANANGEDHHNVYGFNSDTDAPESKDTSSDTSSTESNANGTSSRKETDNDTRARDETEDTGRTLSRIEQGNIGITTTQQMIKEEREVDEFNLMDYIIDSFKKRFCIMVY